MVASFTKGGNSQIEGKRNYLDKICFLSLPNMVKFSNLLKYFIKQTHEKLNLSAVYLYDIAVKKSTLSICKSNMEEIYSYIMQTRLPPKIESFPIKILIVFIFLLKT